MYGYLIDMDGVVYRGGVLIPGADDFFRTLQERQIPFLLLTNNSQRTRRDVVLKMGNLGVAITEDHVFTCAMSTARFLALQKPNGSAYVIGEGGILNALHQNGYAIDESNPDYVVVAEGRTLNFEIVEKALQLVLNGAKLIATNLDPNCPTEKGMRPGCGAIVAMIEAAAGIKAFSVGKPSPIMMMMARHQLNLRTNEVTMVGDTMETDILGGLQMGYRTALVFSGSTRPEDLGRYPYQPTIAVESIAELVNEASQLPDVPWASISMSYDDPDELRMAS